MKTQYTTKHSVVQNSAYYKKHLYTLTFNSPIELYNYIQSKPKGIKNINNTARVYLNYAEKFDNLLSEVALKYRSMLKVKTENIDYYVPTDDKVIDSYNKIKNNKLLEIVFLVLATSGIRYIEALKFLENYDINKFTKYSNYVAYNVSDLRHTKNINNIYLPLFVYKKLYQVTKSYHTIRMNYNRTSGLFALKYLRKWQYNFLIYNNVPESVADFIQGRASKGVSANHYLAKSQQAGFWYSKVVSNLENVFSNIKVSQKLQADSQEAIFSQKNKVGNYSSEANK